MDLCRKEIKFWPRANSTDRSPLRTRVSLSINWKRPQSYLHLPRREGGVPVLTPIQSRMARAALLLGVRDLAEKSGMSAMTVTRFENGHSGGSSETQAALKSAFEAAGVEFIAENGGGAGVRLRSQPQQGYGRVASPKGRSRFDERNGTLGDWSVPTTASEPATADKDDDDKHDYKGGGIHLKSPVFASRSKSG